MQMRQESRSMVNGCRRETYIIPHPVPEAWVSWLGQNSTASPRSLWKQLANCMGWKPVVSAALTYVMVEGWTMLRRDIKKDEEGR